MERIQPAVAELARDAIRTIQSRCPDMAEQCSKLLASIDRVDREMLHKRLSLVYGNAHNHREDEWFTRDEIRVIGQALMALHDGFVTEIETGQRRPGRPVGSGEGRTVTFRLMLTPSERQQLNQLAEDQGQTPSQYIRSKIF